MSINLKEEKSNQKNKKLSMSNIKAINHLSIDCSFNQLKSNDHLPYMDTIDSSKGRNSFLNMNELLYNMIALEGLPIMYIYKCQNYPKCDFDFDDLSNPKFEIEFTRNAPSTDQPNTWELCIRTLDYTEIVKSSSSDGNEDSNGVAHTAAAGTHFKDVLSVPSDFMST